MGPDFNRRVHCILGMPFDELDTEGAVDRVRESVQLGRPCFFSTPNLSFVAAAQTNPALRDSVVRSDMSVPDGIPLVWAARLMGVPMLGRVAGSSMFERLWHRRVDNAERPIKVFFFGGAEGVAELASLAINAGTSGLQCVGHESPGFGSVDEMSGEDLIARINDTGAEFIVVSVGVAKGQAWIERNRERLDAPVISYLGATMNFVAGSVKRAPERVQRMGLEWLWRIKEEPALWRRYASDGKVYARLFFTRLIPYRWNAVVNAPSGHALRSARAELIPDADGATLRIAGAWVKSNAGPLRALLARACAVQGPLRLDLSDVEYADSAVIALLAMLCAHRQKASWPCSVGAIRPQLQRMLRYCCAEYVLPPVSHIAARTFSLEK